MEQANKDVFISYSRKDYVDGNGHVIPGNVLSKIKDTLAQNGVSYWFDEEGIYSGQEFTSVITKAIRTSKVFVFVSSVHSNASAWTSNEIAIAKRLNKPIIPFCIDDSPYNDSVMMLIAALDFIDGRDESVAYSKLVRAISHYIGMDENARFVALDKKAHSYHQDRLSWYEKVVNPFFTPLQKLLVYTQLFGYTLSLLFVIWTSLFGALAVYHHFQLSQFLLMVTLMVSIFATVKLRTGKILWWTIIGVCDFLEVLYVSVLAKYLFVNWNAFSELGRPSSMRYGWLYSIGQDMGDNYFVHPTLLLLAVLHVILICLTYSKGNRKLYGYIIVSLILLGAILFWIFPKLSTNDDVTRYENVEVRELKTAIKEDIHIIDSIYDVARYMSEDSPENKILKFAKKYGEQWNFYEQWIRRYDFESFKDKYPEVSKNELQVIEYEEGSLLRDLSNMFEENRGVLFDMEADDSLSFEEIKANQVYMSSTWVAKYIECKEALQDKWECRRDCFEKSLTWYDEEGNQYSCPDRNALYSSPRFYRFDRILLDYCVHRLKY